MTTQKSQASAAVIAAYEFRRIAFHAAVSQGTEYDAHNPEEPGARLIVLLSCYGPSLSEYGADVGALMADPVRRRVASAIARVAYVLGLGVIADEHVRKRSQSAAHVFGRFKSLADSAVLQMQRNPTDISVLGSCEVLAARRGLSAVLSDLHAAVFRDQLQAIELASRAGHCIESACADGHAASRLTATGGTAMGTVARDLREANHDGR